MPAIGMGTWMTYIGKKIHPSLVDDKRIEEIKTAIDKGVSYIDTAERYINGYGETLIGKAIEKYAREKLFLVSKVSSDHLEYDNIIASAKASIKRLRSSYLDLYLIHQFNPDIPLQESMRAMDYLVEQKLIRNIGVCNFTVSQLQEAQSYTKNKIVANQLHYNLMYRGPEQAGIVAYCQKQDIMIIAWRPFQQELLTPKLTVLLEEMASKYNRIPSQIAAMWLLSQPNIVVLSKLNTISQIEKLSDASQVSMSDKDIALFNTSEK